MYRCRYFGISELVPKLVFYSRGDRAWELLDINLLKALDDLRAVYGKMIINNWFWNGDRMWSGLRIPASPYYSPTSQHTYGRAADIIFEEADVNKVRENILTKPDDYPHQLINAVELNTSWLHIDTRNTERIKTFSK